MITISTGGIGPMDIMTSAKAKGTSKEEKATDAFASLMDMAATKQEKPEITATEDIDVSEVAPARDTAKDYESYKKQESIDTSKDKLQDTEKSVIKEDTQVNDAKEVELKTNEEEQVVDKVVSLVKDVKIVIQDALGITDEELESLLADMGIQLTELMLGDNLKNFILQAQGATNVDLLVNEDLSNLVNNLSVQISEIVSQYGFSFDSNFEQLIANNIENIETKLQAVDENVDIIVDDVNVDNNVVTESNDAVVEDVDSFELKFESKSDSNQAKSNIVEDGLADKMVVKTTDSSEQEMAQEQSPEQSKQQITANFNQAIDNTVASNTGVDVTAFSNNVQEADIIRQIIDQIKVTAGKEVQSMEVQLNPENLGKVYVNVEAKDGVMQAKIIAETEAAKNAIENNLAVLKENFSNNELKVEAIEVMVASYGFFEESQNGDFGNQEQTNDASKSMGGVNINNLDEEELTEEEELEVEIMRTKGNTVSYTV